MRDASAGAPSSFTPDARRRVPVLLGAGCPILLRVLCEEGGASDSRARFPLQACSSRCHPERSKTIRKADHFAKSRDLLLPHLLLTYKKREPCGSRSYPKMETGPSQ